MAPTPVIALTGATGFVGARLLTRLLDNGCRVRALVRHPSRIAHIRHANLEWLEGGLGERDAEFVQGADAVLHVAGVIKARKREDYFRVNCAGTTDLAASAKTAGVRRFVLISSISARVPHLSDYAASKAGGEEGVTKQFGPERIIIRTPAVFGPGDRATKPFFKLIARGLLPCPGGPNWRARIVGMTYLEDLITDILRHAIVGDWDGQTVSPATVGAVTWPQFAESASRAAGRKVHVIPLPRPVLYPVAATISVTSRVFGLGHLTLGKLAEFLYYDWSSSDMIQDATPFETALRDTLRGYGLLDKD